jgi:phage tail sheath gpL-like
MAKKFSIGFTTNDDELPLDSTKESLHRLVNFLQGCLSGSRLGAVTCTVRNSEVAASGTVTLTSMAAAATVTINGVAFTASSTPSGETEFEIDGNDDADAAALAAAINACTNALISNHVTASVANTVVTITAKVPGHAGNAITLASSTEAVSGARLTGGTADSVISYSI